VPVKISSAGHAAARAAVCCLLLAASLASVSCRRETEVRGSVFIVTRGADNQKLGLVVVSAIPADQIKRFVEEKKARVKAQLERLRKANEARGAEVAAAQRAYDEAKKAVDDLTAQKEAVSSRQSELNASSQPNLDDLAEEDLSDSPALAAEVAKQRKVRLQIKALAQQAAKLSSQADAARTRLSSAERQLTSAKAEAAAETLKVLELVNEAALFEGIPEGAAKAVTDADGKFALKLPGPGKYALAARAERRVYDKTERYFWVVWVDVGGKGPDQVMLTNQNMLGQEADESVFDLKELLPKGTLKDAPAGPSGTPVSGTSL
jgi:predicted metal-dependent hydrolase